MCVDAGGGNTCCGPLANEQCYDEPPPLKCSDLLLPNQVPALSRYQNFGCEWSGSSGIFEGDPGLEGLDANGIASYISCDGYDYERVPAACLPWSGTCSTAECELETATFDTGNVNFKNTCDKTGDAQDNNVDYNTYYRNYLNNGDATTAPRYRDYWGFYDNHRTGTSPNGYVWGNNAQTEPQLSGKGSSVDGVANAMWNDYYDACKVRAGGYLGSQGTQVCIDNNNNPVSLTSPDCHESRKFDCCMRSATASYIDNRCSSKQCNLNANANHIVQCDLRPDANPDSSVCTTMNGYAGSPCVKGDYLDHYDDDNTGTNAIQPNHLDGNAGGNSQTPKIMTGSQQIWMCGDPGQEVLVEKSSNYQGMPMIILKTQ